MFYIVQDNPEINDDCVNINSSKASFMIYSKDLLVQSNHLFQHLWNPVERGICKCTSLNILRKKYVVSCASLNLCLNIVVLRQAGGRKKAGAGDSETK